MAGQVPGPLCQLSQPQYVQDGTLCLAQSPAPGSVQHRDASAPELRALEDALAALQSQAEIFAWRFIKDANARKAYVTRIAASARQLLADVHAGVLSPAEAARIANSARNVIMEEVRAITSAMGRAGAEAAKASGLTLEPAIDKAVQKLFP